MCSFLTLLSYICPPLSPFVPPLSPFALFRRSVTKLNDYRASLAFCPLVPLVPRIFGLFLVAVLLCLPTIEKRPPPFPTVALLRSAPASGLHRRPIGRTQSEKKITPLLHNLRPRFEHIRAKVRTPQLFPLMVKRRLHQFRVFQFVATPRAETRACRSVHRHYLVSVLWVKKARSARRNIER